MNLQKCDNCKNREKLCFLCKENNKYEHSDFSHDKEIYDKGYAEGKNDKLIAEIKIDADTMSKMIEEKLYDIRAEILGIRNKAIDEFASELENHSIYADTGKGDEVKMEWVSPVTRIKEIAEQLKGGAE